MKVAILETGAGGRIHAEKLKNLGHEIIMGTRNPKITMAQTEVNMMGLPPYPKWHQSFPDMPLDSVVIRYEAKKPYNGFVRQREKKKDFLHSE